MLVLVKLLYYLMYLIIRFREICENKKGIKSKLSPN